MKVDIFSREDMEGILADHLPANTAVISFRDPETKPTPKKPIDYSSATNRIFQIALHDIDIDILDKYGLTYETYFPEAAALAKFIYEAKADGLDIICQCEYGQSRSAGCAAAILEHFYGTGISIFADYRYYPNQMVFHKVFDALEAVKDSSG